MRNRFGVCEWSLPVTGPFGVRLAAAAGFDGVQLGDLGGIAAGFPMNHKRVQEGYLQAASDCGVTFQALHPYGLQRQGTMLSVRGTSGWDEAYSSLSKCVDACAEMGIPEIMVSSFFATMVRNDWELDVYAQHLLYLCDMAEDAGITVSYESALTVKKLRKLIDLTDGRLKICYDLLNPVTLGVSSPASDIGALVAGSIAHFHVKDAPPDMKNCCLIGDGMGGIPKLASVIRKSGYTGWFVSENNYSFLAASGNGDFLAYAAEDVAAMKRIFGSGE